MQNNYSAVDYEIATDVYFLPFILQILREVQIHRKLLCFSAFYVPTVHNMAVNVLYQGEEQELLHPLCTQNILICLIATGTKGKRKYISQN